MFSPCHTRATKSPTKNKNYGDTRGFSMTVIVFICVVHRVRTTGSSPTAVRNEKFARLSTSSVQVFSTGLPGGKRRAGPEGSTIGFPAIASRL